MRALATLRSSVLFLMAVAISVVVLMISHRRTTLLYSARSLSNSARALVRGDRFATAILVEDHRKPTGNQPSGITDLSQNPNIDERGKLQYHHFMVWRSYSADYITQWQQLQIQHYCEKYHLNDVAYQLPTDHNRENLFRHILLDDSRKLLFCFVPKVACTTMRRFLFVIQGLIPEETIHKQRIKEHVYLTPHLEEMSFRRESLNDSERTSRLKHYFKFMIVRNPLDRLLSAFRDKIMKPVSYSVLSRYPHGSMQRIFDDVKLEILEKYSSDLYHTWIACRGAFPLKVSFTNYLKWVAEKEWKDMNEHFLPTIGNCNPCRVRYDFYGNFKTLNTDMFQMAKELGVAYSFFNSNPIHRNTSDYLEHFYSQVPYDTKMKLLNKIAPDLDFYYHLYPEDVDSHVKLLGINMTKTFL